VPELAALGGAGLGGAGVPACAPPLRALSLRCLAQLARARVPSVLAALSRPAGRRLLPALLDAAVEALLADCRPDGLLPPPPQPPPPPAAPLDVALVESVFQLLGALAGNVVDCGLSDGEVVRQLLRLLADAQPRHAQLLATALRLLEAFMEFQSAGGGGGALRDAGGVRALLQRLRHELDPDGGWGAADCARCEAEEAPAASHAQRSVAKALMRCCGLAALTQRAGAAAAAAALVEDGCPLAGCLSAVYRQPRRWGGGVYSLAMNLMADTLHNAPSAYAPLAAAGAPAALLAALRSPATLGSADGVCALPSVLGALALSEQGLRELLPASEQEEDCGALQPLLRALAGERGARSLASGDAAGMLAAGLDELLRHAPQLRPAGARLLRAALRQLLQAAAAQPAWLPDAVAAAARLLEGTLGAAETLRLFLEGGGLPLLLQLACSPDVALAGAAAAAAAAAQQLPPWHAPQPAAALAACLRVLPPAAAAAAGAALREALLASLQQLEAEEADGMVVTGGAAAVSEAELEPAARLQAPAVSRAAAAAEAALRLAASAQRALPAALPPLLLGGEAAGAPGPEQLAACEALLAAVGACELRALRGAAAAEHACRAQLEQSLGAAGLEGAAGAAAAALEAAAAEAAAAGLPLAAGLEPGAPPAQRAAGLRQLALGAFARAELAGAARRAAAAAAAEAPAEAPAAAAVRELVSELAAALLPAAGAEAGARARALAAAEAALLPALQAAAEGAGAAGAAAAGGGQHRAVASAARGFLLVAQRAAAAAARAAPGRGAAPLQRSVCAQLARHSIALLSPGPPAAGRARFLACALDSLGTLLFDGRRRAVNALALGFWAQLGGPAQLQRTAAELAAAWWAEPAPPPSPLVAALSALSALLEALAGGGWAAGASAELLCAPLPGAQAPGLPPPRLQAALRQCALHSLLPIWRHGRCAEAPARLLRPLLGALGACCRGAPPPPPPPEPRAPPSEAEAALVATVVEMGFGAARALEAARTVRHATVESVMEWLIGHPEEGGGGGGEE